MWLFGNRVQTKPKYWGCPFIVTNVVDHDVDPGADWTLTSGPAKHLLKSIQKSQEICCAPNPEICIALARNRFPSQADMLE